MNTEQQFHKKYVPVTETGCGLWTAGVNPGGYGTFWDGAKVVLAHRFAWTLANGPIPDGMCVLHKCDTPSCVNPDHLFLGTQAENNADRAAKGRGADQRGSKNSNAKLTDALAVEIFHATGTQKDVAARHGIHESQVWHIKNRKRWAHATERLAA